MLTPLAPEDYRRAMTQNQFVALEEAITIAGSLRKLAKRIGKGPTTVQYWRSQGRIPRGEDAIAVHKAVDGRISKARLAPHCFGGGTK